MNSNSIGNSFVKKNPSAWQIGRGFVVDRAIRSQSKCFVDEAIRNRSNCYVDEIFRSRSDSCGFVNKSSSILASRFLLVFVCVFDSQSDLSEWCIISSHVMLLSTISDLLCQSTHFRSGYSDLSTSIRHECDHNVRVQESIYNRV